MSLALRLVDWAKQSREKNHQAYLLLDSAQAEGSHVQLERWQIPFESLFEGKTEASLPEIAPLLIPLFDLSAANLERVCDWAMQLAYRAPCLCWMESTLAAKPFAEHLRNFHTVALSEGQRMMMRWYDTRILPAWLACLNPEQAKQFTASMFSLQYVNRFGETATPFETTSPVAAPETPPFGKTLIALTDTQYAMLIDASDTDTLVSHLRRVITDETNKLTPRILFEFVGKYQQRAVEAGIDDLDRQTQYVLLALYTSGKGVEHPACVALMKKPPVSLDDFYAAMQALPEDTWNAGTPLWDQVQMQSMSNLH